MIVCGACGRPNEDNARFCAACGRPTVAPPAPPTPPPPTAPTTRRPVPGAALLGRLAHPSPRVLFAYFLIVIFLLSLIALATPWWTYTATEGGGVVSVNFLPGSSYNVTCSGAHCGGFSAGSFPYSAFGGSIGTLYEVVLGLLVASVALTGLAALLGGLSALGRRVIGAQRSWTFVLGALGVLVLLATLATIVGVQAGALPSGSFTTGAGASPSSSFWGSSSTGAASWGAGTGWYCALAAVILLFVGIVLFLVLERRHPMAAPERRATVSTTWRRASNYRPPPTAPAPARSVTPTPTSTAPPSALPAASPSPVAPDPAMVACPECGTPNLARSRTCSYCQRPLR
ncbi:MAG: hypothetical protein ACRECT_04035 [Thermoplasmata archaeon]